MPRYSRNPITVTVTTTTDFEPVEIDIQLERHNLDDTFDSLGIFTFTSNASSQVKEQVQDILHAGMMLNALESMPTQTNSAAACPALCRKWRYRHRHFTAGAWTSWTTSADFFVILGGEPMEIYGDTFETGGSGQPIILGPEDLILRPNQARGFVYVLVRNNSSMSYTFQFYQEDDQPASTVTGSISPGRAKRVVRIPVPNMPAGASPYFKVSVTNNSMTVEKICIAEMDYQPYQTDLMYLNSRGGFSFLPCTGAMIAELEVNNQVTELSLGENYYSQKDFGSLRTWKTTGKKTMKVNTGWMPHRMLNDAVQDLLLSRLRFMYLASRQKFIPILLSGKGITYRSDGTMDLYSADITFEPAFEIIGPSEI
jgi:hypothetical protein